MFRVLIAVAMATTVQAHISAWADGMYCKGGNITGKPDLNTRLASTPLWNLTREDWWFQHTWGCDQAPPPEGEFLELPAGGDFTVELAHGQQFTTLSYDGQFSSEWPGGDEHPEDWQGPGSPPGCIADDGLMHVQNESMATGSAFAISYQPDLADVTMENLAVFTVLEHTPWKRIATYKVPDLPACPPGGCTCAWLWIPNGCGEPNMYMAGFKCNVTGATSTVPVAAAKPPVWCPEGSGTACVKGAKQMMAWNQLTGNNVDNTVYNSPGYNVNMGYLPGAQNDIFEISVESTSTRSSPSTSRPATSSAPTSTRYTSTTFSRVTTSTTQKASTLSSTVDSQKTPTKTALPYSRFEAWADYMWTTWQDAQGSGTQSRNEFEAWVESSWGTWTSGKAV